MYYEGQGNRGNTIADEERKMRKIVARSSSKAGSIGFILRVLSSYIHFNALDIMYSIVVHNAIDQWNIYRALAIQNVRDMKDTDGILDYS